MFKIIFNAYQVYYLLTNSEEYYYAYTGTILLHVTKYT